MKNNELTPARIACLIALCVAVVVSSGTSLASLKVVGLNVGQGDCTLIISPTGKSVLVDAGYTGEGTGTVIPYLQTQGIDALDYTVASHYHVDHIGGLDEVVNTLGRDSIRVAAYDRGYNYTTQAYTQYVNAVGAKRQTMTEYQVLDLGGGATLTCLGLNSMGVLAAPYDDGRYDDNNLCIALLLEYGEFQMVLAGDLPGLRSGSYYDIESILAARAGDVDVYKVDHHGSASSSQNALLNAALPEASLIYVGNGNSYGHPTQAVIDRLVAVGSYIYQTELGAGGTIPPGEGEVANGHIVITVDPGQYTINGEVYGLGTAGVDVTGVTPGADLLRIYPNPFYDRATVSFGLSDQDRIAVRIFDASGRLVASRSPDHGAGTITWDGRSIGGGTVPAGVYFICISGPSGDVAGKLVKR